MRAFFAPLGNYLRAGKKVGGEPVAAYLHPHGHGMADRQTKKNLL